MLFSSENVSICQKSHGDQATSNQKTRESDVFEKKKTPNQNIKTQAVGSYLLMLPSQMQSINAIV